MRRPKTLAQVEAMEEEKGSSSSSPGSRWNPTKEQIAILEGLYRQGIRTPSAEQIQHITGKLREFGTIEGKNVFYWFQNHKARQRQKQKQENFAYFTRLLHHQPPPPPPQGCTNVMYTPFCFPVPQVGAAGYYQGQLPTVFMPGAMKRKSPKPEPQRLETAKETDPDTQKNMPSISLETLQLFPLHPTGILEGKSGSSLTSASAESESVEDGDEEQGSENLPFFNFFDGPKRSP